MSGSSRTTLPQARRPEGVAESRAAHSRPGEFFGAGDGRAGDWKGSREAPPASGLSFSMCAAAPRAPRTRSPEGEGLGSRPHDDPRGNPRRGLGWDFRGRGEPPRESRSPARGGHRAANGRSPGGPADGWRVAGDAPPCVPQRQSRGALSWPFPRGRRPDSAAPRAALGARGGAGGAAGSAGVQPTPGTRPTGVGGQPLGQAEAPTTHLESVRATVPGAALR